MTTPTPLRDWHTLPQAEVLQALETSEQGLSRAEAAARLNIHGLNRLPQQPPPSWWQILLRQFQSPLIYVLLAAAVVAVAVGDAKDAVFIAIVLLINALIGGYQEWRAEQSNRALQQLLRVTAAAVRDGEVREVDAESLVPGDVVWLESGARVPADLRLLSAQGLEVDESLLTGESLAVTKDASWVGAAATPPADRYNLAYAATVVVRGRAKGVVVATGAQTMVGQLAMDVFSAAGGKPPLVERMERFAHTVAYAVLVAVAAVALLGIVVHGHTLHDMFMFGVALAVSAIPEGLPAALTVALSIGVARMARRGVIVRRLAAVEGLGSCTLIASDKTGTLTCNELTVVEVRLADGTVLQVEGQGFAPHGQVCLDGKAVRADDQPLLASLLRAAMLCNEADLHQRDGTWSWRGDPTDIALLSLGHKAGWQRETLLEQHPQVNEIPFEPERQFAATFHRDGDAVHVFVKGAPERVLNMCRWEDPDRREHLRAVAEQMAAADRRVLAVAEGVSPASLSSGDVPLPPQELEFLGYVGMIDPLRPGVREAVADCHNAGITVCMVTGDHPVTALAISRELGLADSPQQVVTGAELTDKTPEELRAAIRQGRVFARLVPRQKLELVQAAQAEGHYVAVTGDGVNDAPALRAANIGVAMGKGGTDVAREAADLVISDDNFATIVAGVEEGRVAYDNVRKVIYLLVSMGAAEVLLVALAFAAGDVLPLPLLPVQLLWLNLVTNGIQGIALAFEPAKQGILRRRPRSPTEPIFNRLMIERTLVAAVVVAGVGVAAFWWMIRHGWTAKQASNSLLLLLVLFENVHIGNCRSETRSALVTSPLRSPFLFFGVLGALAVHVLAMYTPLLQKVLRTEPVSLRTWLAMAGLSSTVFLAMELHKWVWRWRGNPS
ncbi:MAG: HAD-IC family P-type ATPase [Pirellulales bacterium]|nr:HAD-IC family P-type ATPase [Pirellulales bacterium]